MTRDSNSTSSILTYQSSKRQSRNKTKTMSHDGSAEEMTFAKQQLVFDELVEKYSLRKTLRICAWVQRFLHNCRTQPDQRESGPLKWKKIQKRDVWWIKKVQNEATNNPETETIKSKLNLQPNESGILDGRGRIDGEYPIYLPRNNTYTQKVVEQAHQNTLHGSVAMTMAKVRDRFWVPKLRCLVKQIRSNCHGSVRFRA